MLKNVILVMIGLMLAAGIANAQPKFYDGSFETQIDAPDGYTNAVDLTPTDSPWFHALWGPTRILDPSSGSWWGQPQSG